MARQVSGLFLCPNMPILQSIPNRSSNNYIPSPKQSVPGQYSAAGIYNQPLPSTARPVSQVLGVSAPFGGGSTGQSSVPAGMGTLTNNINSQLNTGLSAIDSGYNDFVSQINTQQGNVERSAADATANVDVNAQGAKTALTNQQTTANQSYDTQAQTANKQASSALQQSRDLYRQLQQQNVAQLSGAGLSSSSVAEALAENLGVETARRIAGVTGSRDEVLNNISRERTNLNNYVSQQMTDLEGKITAAKNTIQTQLLNSIDQLNNQRNVAASQKANSRQQLISDAQGQIANLQAQAQNFAQSLEQWHAQNTSKLQNTAISFDNLTKAMQTASNFQGVGLGQPMQSNEQTAAYYINPQKNPYEDDILNRYLPG